jgi:peptide/nickel transport system substrate-binding protein
MLPAHIARKAGWNRGFDAFNPALDLSAGPLILHSVSPTGSAVLIRNPHWWGAPSVLDRVRVNVTTDRNGWPSSLSGNSHAVTQPNSFDLGTLNRVSSLPNTESAIKPSLRFLQLEFNMDSPALARAGRQAVAHALDRTTLLAHTFGSIDPDLVINQDHLATPAQSAYSASSAAGEYVVPDLQSTDRLLRTIGYHQNAAGNYVDSTGKQLTLRMAVETGDPWIATVAAQLGSQLRSAGIAVVTSSVAGQAGMVAAAAANSYDMAVVSRTASPYLTATASWFSDGEGPVGSSGTQDWSKFDDPEVDQLFAQASQALDPVTGGNVYSQIDDQLWDQMVALPLFGEPGLLASGVQLSGVQYNPSPDGVLWNVPQWALLKPGPSSGHA